MREITSKKITETIRDLTIQANYEISEDVLQALNDALRQETSSIGKGILNDLIKNAEIARKDVYPLCQDTGMAVVFLEIGQEVKITGEDIEKAVKDGVEQGYKKGVLRKSIVKDPFVRENTGTNTPAKIHYNIVPGNKIKIVFMAKGGGAENKSAFKMFKPTCTKEEIVDFVVETVVKAGGEACPPLVLGIGIGSNLEGSALLAKKALLRKLDQLNNNESIAQFEGEILNKVNSTGVGPAGLGGKTTALSVAVETGPCHIASLPVTVNIDCHAHRVKEAVL